MSLSPWGVLFFFAFRLASLYQFTMGGVLTVHTAHIHPLVHTSMLQLESSEQKQIMTDSANWQIYTNRKIIHRSHLADLMKNIPLVHSPAPTPCPKRPPAKICSGACTSQISQIFCLTLLCHPLLQFPPSQRCTGHTSLPWGYTASPFSRSCS